MSSAAVFRHRPLWIILKAEISESIRNKWLLIYGLSFLIFIALINSQGISQTGQTVVSLLNLILLIIPLFSMLFGSVSFSESLPYMELTLIHGASRKELFFGKYLGLGCGLTISFFIGSLVGLVPFLDSWDDIEFIFLLLFLGVLLNFIFLSISFILSIFLLKKEIILAGSLLVWFYFYILYDIMIMGTVILFKDYPLEIPILIMVALNPVDLVRVVLLLNMDLSTIMGIGTASVKSVLGNIYGVLCSCAVLFFWIWFLFKISLKKFMTKDLY